MESFLCKRVKKSDILWQIWMYEQFQSKILIKGPNHRKKHIFCKDNFIHFLFFFNILRLLVSSFSLNSLLAVNCDILWILEIESRIIMVLYKHKIGFILKYIYDLTVTFTTFLNHFLWTISLLAIRFFDSLPDDFIDTHFYKRGWS